MSAAFSGPSQDLGVELHRGSLAYFRFINQQGGINGRVVSMRVLDDGYNPDPAIENTIRFIEEEHALCLFDYVGTPTVTRVLPVIKSYADRDVYLFFPFTGAEPQRQEPYSRYVFNLRASYRQELAGLVEKFHQIGRSRIAVLYQADAYGRSGWDGVRRALAPYGLDIVAEATYARGATFDQSMSQQVRIILEGRPDAVVCVGSYAACAAFVRDAREAGFEAPIANLSFVGSESMLALLKHAEQISGHSYTHHLVNTQVVPSYEDLSLPAVVEYRELIQAQGIPGRCGSETPARGSLYSFASFEGFLNAKVMVEVLRRMGDDLRPMRLPLAAESIQNLDIGIDVPVRFGPGRHQGLDKVYFTTVRQGVFMEMTAEDWQGWRP